MIKSRSDIRRFLIKITVVFVFTNIIIPAQTVAIGEEYTIPSLPLDPTSKFCKRLSSRFHQIIMELHSKRLNCMKQKPSFGVVRSCGGGTEAVAWEQCQYIQCEIYNIKLIRDSKVKRCNRLARKNHKSSADLYVNNAHRVVKNYHKIESLQDRAKKITSLINNPENYLREILSPYKKARELVYGLDGAQYNDEAANDVYDFLFDEVEDGMLGTSKNPTIQSIQRESLRAIIRHNNKIMNELDSVIFNIDTYDYHQTQWEKITTDSVRRYEQLKLRRNSRH